MKFANGCIRVLGSVWFFWAIVAAFIVSALSIALTARLELYDEYFHLGIIQVYSHQFSPFIAHQTLSTDAYGDLTKLGSFFYHWTLSFPYRWMVDAGMGSRSILIVLRIITVAIAAAALPWFRRMLLDVGVSSAVSNTAIGVYCALPITSFLAATVNYDNLMLLFAAVFLSLAVRCYVDTRQSIAFYAMLFAMGAFACITKYEFLPIYGCIAIVVVIRYVIVNRKLRGAAWWPQLGGGETGGITRTVVAGVILLFGAVLFAARYFGNLIEFHSLQPDCQDVQTVQFCSAWAPWARNQSFLAAHPTPTPFSPSLLAWYFQQWKGGIIGTLPTVGTEAGSGKGAAFTLMMIQGGATIAVVVFVLALWQILKRPGFHILLIAAAFYAIVLFNANFSYYRTYGVPATIQSRYLLMFVPVLLGATGFGLARIVRAMYGRAAPLMLLLVFVILVVAATQGGYFTTFMLTAAPNWFTTQGFTSHVLALFRWLAEHIERTR